MNWRDGESNPKILQYSAAFFQRFDHPHGATLKIERKMSQLNIKFDRYASIGTDALHFGTKRSVNFGYCIAPALYAALT